MVPVTCISHEIDWQLYWSPVQPNLSRPIVVHRSWGDLGADSWIFHSWIVFGGHSFLRWTKDHIRIVLLLLEEETEIFLEWRRKIYGRERGAYLHIKVFSHFLRPIFILQVFRAEVQWLDHWIFKLLTLCKLVHHFISSVWRHIFVSGVGRGKYWTNRITTRNNGTLNFESFLLRLKKQTTVEPRLSGHPRGNGKWLLNRGWPLNRGFIYSVILILRLW